MVGWVRQVVLLYVGRSHPVRWSPVSLSKREHLLPVSAGTSVFPCLWAWTEHWLFFEPAAFWTGTYTTGFPNSQALRPELHHQFPWVSSLPSTNVGTCQPSQSHEPISYSKLFEIHVYILFLWRTLIQEPLLWGLKLMSDYS